MGGGGGGGGMYDSAVRDRAQVSQGRLPLSE